MLSWPHFIDQNAKPQRVINPGWWVSNPGSPASRNPTASLVPTNICLQMPCLSHVVIILCSLPLVARTHSTLESPAELYVGTAACQLGQNWPVLVLPHHLPPSKVEMAPSLEGADLWEFASKKLHSQKIQAPLGSDNTSPGASACQHLGALFTSKQATKWCLQDPSSLRESVPSSVQAAESHYLSKLKEFLCQRDSGQRKHDLLSPALKPINGRIGLRAREVRIKVWGHWNQEGPRSTSNPKVLLHRRQSSHFLLPAEPTANLSISDQMLSASCRKSSLILSTPIVPALSLTWLICLSTRQPLCSTWSQSCSQVLALASGPAPINTV